MNCGFCGAPTSGKLYLRVGQTTIYACHACVAKGITKTVDVARRRVAKLFPGLTKYTRLLGAGRSKP